MTTLSLKLDDKKAAVLREKAEMYGLKIEDLVIASIEDLLSRTDEDFERAAQKVLSKNAELYRRLA